MNFGREIFFNHLWELYYYRQLQLAVCSLTLAKLHVLVLTSFFKLIKLLQNLMMLLPNHIVV